MDKDVSWGGVRYAAVDDEGALALVLRAARDRSGVHVHLCNAWTVVLATDEPSVAEVLQRDDAINLVDGVPLAKKLSALAGRAISTSRGPTLFDRAIIELGRRGFRQMFVGSTDAVLDVIESKLVNSGVLSDDIVTYSPPFAPLSDEVVSSIVRVVEDARPQIVWVGMGTPKQDLLAAALARNTGLPAVCVGAAFDFFAGSVQQAPRWVRGSGFEWLYRLLSEPRRLWKRYTYGNLKFLKLSRTMK